MPENCERCAQLKTALIQTRWHMLQAATRLEEIAGDAKDGGNVLRVMQPLRRLAEELRDNSNAASRITREEPNRDCAHANPSL